MPEYRKFACQAAKGITRIERKFLVVHYVIFSFLLVVVLNCGPGRGGASRRKSYKLIPLVYKQHVPNVPERSLAASGPSLGRVRRDDMRFRRLIPNYNPDIVFKDEEGNGADRVMTKLCQEKLDTLAVSVMNQWPGVKLRVTESWDEEGLHSRDSLHYEGRAVDITTSDKDRAKYGTLARLAVEAGFHWVYYESRSHIHCSVKPESSFASKAGGCFAGDSTIITPHGERRMNQLMIGQKVLTATATGELHFSEVYTFLHREIHSEQVFVAVRTVARNSTFHLTPWHLVFVSDSNCTESEQRTEFKTHSVVIHARDLKAGDHVFEVRGLDEIRCVRVTEVQLVLLTGVYAPVTLEGTMVVDRTIVSCYAIVQKHSTAHLALAPLRILYNLESSFHFLTGELFSSTMACDACGWNWYANILHRFASAFSLI